MNLTKFIKLCLALALSSMIVNFAYAIAGDNIYNKGRKASFTYSIKPWYKYHKDGTAGREVVIYFDHQKAKQKVFATVTCEGKTNEFATTLSDQEDSLSFLLPEHAGLKSTTVALNLAIGDERFHETLVVPAKKQWTVYIYPHSHVDIGYTNLQDVVEKLHVRNIDVGIDIANQNKRLSRRSKICLEPRSNMGSRKLPEKCQPPPKTIFY